MNYNCPTCGHQLGNPAKPGWIEEEKCPRCAAVEVITSPILRAWIQGVVETAIYHHRFRYEHTYNPEY
jgi:phage FluMu protein Com